MASMVAYWTPKQGTVPSDWEDGVAYSTSSGWFALADGASSGAGSREWAYTLASRFVADRPAAVLEDGDGTAFVRWVEATRRAFDPHSAEFPVSQMPKWVQDLGEREGAHATFLGGRVDTDGIHAVAVGDCCLFHSTVAGVTAFPVARAEDFGSAPDLVGSVAPDGNARLASQVHHFHARAVHGQVVFAASDALAEWLVRHLDRPDVWRQLADLGRFGFAGLCRDLRHRREMKNDDTTLWRATETMPVPR